jgi:hypothetical protein
MASGNAYRALDAWPDLPAVPRLVLVTMALVARDNPTEEYDAAHYFGGPEFLQQKVWGRCDGSTARQLKKAITTLVRAGAITRRTRGAPGRRAEYDLVLSRSEQGTETVPGQGTVKVRTGDRNGPAQGTETVPPKETREIEKKEEEEKSPGSFTSPAPVDNSGAEQMSTEQANRELIKRQGLEHALRLLAQHAATHPDCENPAGHLLATPSLTVIKGGKTA